MATYCDLCHEPTRNRKRDKRGAVLCPSCREWEAYYASLTTEERNQEAAAMAAYVAERESETY